MHQRMGLGLQSHVAWANFHSSTSLSKKRTRVTIITCSMFFYLQQLQHDAVAKCLLPTYHGFP